MLHGHKGLVFLETTQSGDQVKSSLLFQSYKGVEVWLIIMALLAPAADLMKLHNLKYSAFNGFYCCLTTYRSFS